MNYFFDSSAFTKLFVQEPGTQTVISLYEPLQTPKLSALAFLETRSAIRRRESSGDLSPVDALLALQLLQEEQRRVGTLAVSERVLLRAGELIDRHQLRALDAIQLASTIESSEGQAITFVCSDTRLLKAATDEGIATLNPAIMS